MFEYWGLFYVGGLGVLLGLFGLLFRNLFYFFINIQFGVLGGGVVRRIYEKGMEYCDWLFLFLLLKSLLNFESICVWFI